MSLKIAKTMKIHVVQSVLSLRIAKERRKKTQALLRIAMRRYELLRVAENR